MMARRMMRKYHVRCRAGEKVEIVSKPYLSPCLIEDFGNILLTKGIQVKCLNLCEMQKSMGYNPFLFIRKPSDVSKLITNIISNTTPADVVSSADPFWESATCSQAVKSLRIGAI